MTANHKNTEIVITGLGHIASKPGCPAKCNPRAYLKISKTRKFMGLQDKLAVVAAGKALESANLVPTLLGEKAGLFISVGFISFDQSDIDKLYTNSLKEGEFSMHAFSTEGVDSVRPTLTFRCLPNMPAFHVSSNFNIQGPYFVTYPGVGQFYLALEQAMTALKEKKIKIALVGGVAHQQNFLTLRHFARLSPPVPSERLADGAGFIVLESRDHAELREAVIRGKIIDSKIKYTPYNPFEKSLSHNESFTGGTAEELGELGPASLPVWLSSEEELQSKGIFTHSLKSRDSFDSSSSWELL